MFEHLSAWLESTSWHEAFSAASWFVPTVQTVHILGIAAVVTTLAMLNVRLLRGTEVAPPLQEMSRRFLPWTWCALVVLLLTGILLVITEPGRELASTPFRIKMLLVVALAILTAIVQTTVKKDARYWYASPTRRRAASLIGVANLVLCVAIVAAGRLIAYVVHG